MENLHCDDCPHSTSTRKKTVLFRPLQTRPPLRAFYLRLEIPTWPSTGSRHIAPLIAKYGANLQCNGCSYFAWKKDYLDAQRGTLNMMQSSFELSGAEYKIAVPTIGSREPNFKWGSAHMPTRASSRGGESFAPFFQNQPHPPAQIVIRIGCEAVAKVNLVTAWQQIQTTF